MIHAGLRSLDTLASERIRFHPLVGAASRYRGPRADAGEMFVWLLIAVGVIAVVCVVLYALNRMIHRWRYNSHPALFYGLCKVHGLDGNARRLLKQVARFHNLARPTRLFIDPKWLDPANLGGSFRARTGELWALRQRLFERAGAKNAGRGPNRPNEAGV
jgi:hypothetical protein